MIVRWPSLLLTMIGALASAADQQPAEPSCQKLTGAERTECERQAREQERERAAAPQPEPDKNEPPPDTKSEGNDDSDTADPPQP